MGCCRERGSVNVISTLEQRNEPTTTMLVCDIHGDPSHPTKGVVTDVEATQEVIPPAVESCRHDNEVWTKPSYGREKLGVPTPEHICVCSSAVEVDVDIQTLTFAGAA